DFVELRYYDVNAGSPGWIIVRRDFAAHGTAVGGSKSLADNTTDLGPALSTVSFDVGGISDLGGNKVTIRRTGIYSICARATLDNIGDGRYLGVGIRNSSSIM